MATCPREKAPRRNTFVANNEVSPRSTADIVVYSAPFLQLALWLGVHQCLDSSSHRKALAGTPLACKLISFLSAPGVRHTASIFTSSATLAWSPLFAGYYTYLTTNVTVFRLQTGHVIGHDAINGVSQKAMLTDPEKKKEAERKLQVACRAHANYAENVPLSMLLIAVAEINGAPTWLIHTGYAVLFVARVIHVEFGLRNKETTGWGRILGHYTNQIVIYLGFGAYNFALGYDALKTFFGL